MNEKILTVGTLPVGPVTSMEQVIQKMGHLSETWQIPILFGDCGENGSVAMVPIIPEDLPKLLMGEEIEYKWDDYDKMTLPVIKVNRQYMEDNLNWLELRHLEALLRHEYGHIICEYQIEEMLMTEKEMIEYRIKSKIVDDLIWFYSKQKRTDICHEIIKIYNALKLERLANTYGEVNLIDLLEAGVCGQWLAGDPAVLIEPYSKLVDYTLGKRDHKILRRMSEEVRNDAKTKETAKDYMNMLLNIYYIIFPPADLIEYKRLVGI